MEFDIWGRQRREGGQAIVLMGEWGMEDSGRLHSVLLEYSWESKGACGGLSTCCQAAKGAEGESSLPRLSLPKLLG